MPIFRRNKSEPDRDEPGARRIINAWEYVPASVRTPDENRLAATVFTELEDDEDTDEDIEFLKELASSVEGVPLRRAGRLTSAIPSTNEAMSRVTQREPVAGAAPGDGLELFRTVRAEEVRTNVLASVSVDDVELDDLVEDLSTTAAALRRRRAA